MLCVVLNERTASGISAKNAKVQAGRARPKTGNVGITKVQKDGKYVIVFDVELRGYAFGTWLKEHSVTNEVVRVSEKELSKKLAELLPELTRQVLGTRSLALLKREETIRTLLEEILGQSPERSARSALGCLLSITPNSLQK